MKTSHSTEQWTLLGNPSIALSIQISLGKWASKSQNQYETNEYRYSGISNQYWYNQDDLNLCNKLSIHNLAFETFHSVILLLFVVNFKKITTFFDLKDMFRCYEHDRNIIVSYCRIFENPIGHIATCCYWVLRWIQISWWIVYPVNKIPSIDDSSLLIISSGISFPNMPFPE